MIDKKSKKCLLAVDKVAKEQQNANRWVIKPVNKMVLVFVLTLGMCWPPYWPFPLGKRLPGYPSCTLTENTHIYNMVYEE